MADMIRNYTCGYRQAVIIKRPDRPEPGADYEYLYIHDEMATFLSDGSSFLLNDASKALFEDFSEGDIVEINERGLLNRTFCFCDSDATIFMTGNCNSNCIMCPSSDYERKLDYGDRRDVIKDYISMLPHDLKNYVVTGGEPTMNPDLFLEIMKLLAERFPRAEGLVLTNGRSLSILPFLEKMLEYCPPFLTFAIPLHGSTAALHDCITRSEGSYKQTMQGIRHLLNRGISVEIRIVVTKINQADITDLCKLIASEFPNTFRVNFISLEVRGNCFTYKDEVYIEPRDSFLASKEGIRILISKGINVGLYNYPLCCIDSGYQFLSKDSISHEKIRYAAECESCRLREYCGGLFVSTLKTAKPKLYPCG